jgi:hypothetical protein
MSEEERGDFNEMARVDKERYLREKKVYTTTLEANVQKQQKLSQAQSDLRQDMYLDTRHQMAMAAPPHQQHYYYLPSPPQPPPHPPEQRTPEHARQTGNYYQPMLSPQGYAMLPAGNSAGKQYPPRGQYLYPSPYPQMVYHQRDPRSVSNPTAEAQLFLSPPNKGPPTGIVSVVADDESNADLEDALQDEEKQASIPSSE